MGTQLLILLSSPALEPTGRIPLLCQVFQTLGFLLCLPWTARWWATVSPQISVHQHILHTRLTEFFSQSPKASTCSSISSPQTHRAPRPRSPPRPRPSSTLGGPGSGRPPLSCTFSHPLHAFLLIILQVCVQAQAWKIGSSHWPSPLDR